MTALPDLTERIQKAIVRGRGIRFEAPDLDMLVAIGFFDLVQTETAKLLRNQCLTRSMMNRSIQGERLEAEGRNTGSDITSLPTARAVHPISTSSGMTPTQDTSGLARRARRMSSRPKKD
ncbi:hypothetical protein AI27_06550 [Sphingomonas sp. BHC-A]|nr:hypothetical protein AI27_06550 [Sphingomonas sp. BHC-A]